MATSWSRRAGCARPWRWPGPGRRPADELGGLRDRHGPRHPALGGSLEAELSLLLGQPWDDELESFRHAGAGAPVRWLNATG